MQRSPTRLRISYALPLVFAIFCGSVSAATATSNLSEFDKEALTLIKEMTSNLLYLAVGVFALVGGYLASSDSASIFETAWRKIVLLVAFLLFGVSLSAGLVVLMALANQLIGGEFQPEAPWIRGGSVTQIVSAFLGAVFFFLFLFTNILFHKRSTTKPPTTP